MRKKFHLPGMRTLKTMVAVAICFLIFLPFWETEVGPGDNILDHVGPFYACIAAIVCMQDSVKRSVKQGISRLIGTGIGGCVGIVILWISGEESSPLLFGVLLALGVMTTIWICDLLRKPAACSIGGVVCCAVLLSHGGPERYFYLLARMGETAIGILIGVAVNCLLPDHRMEGKDTNDS